MDSSRFGMIRNKKTETKMKKKTLLILLMMACHFTNVMAQGFVINMKDGTKVIYRSSEVLNMTVISAEEGLIIGEWHLGYWKYGNRYIHFDGTECMTFCGSEMSWTGRQDGSDTYALSYSSDNTTFTATNTLNPSDFSTWTIIKYTDKLLVLRNSGADRYFYRTVEEAQNAVMELDPPSHAEMTDINQILAYATGYTKSDQTPMGVHYANRHQTDDNDRAWLLNPDNEPNGVAGMSLWVAKSVNLYPYGDPVPADVNQHAIGDCSACAVFASMAYLYPLFIKSIITDNGNGTYTIKMYDPQGERVDVCVSNKVLCNSSGTIGQVTGKNNVVTWATIMEKAFMKWEKVYAVDGIEGIGTEYLAPLFTGNGESFAFSANRLHASELKILIEWAMAQGKIAVGGFNVAGLKCGVLETVTAHAFTFMLSNNSSSLFAMRNPWGIESVDGILEIPDERIIVQTIDVRIVEPGAAAPYLRDNMQPYTPPVFVKKKSDIGVAPRLMRRVITEANQNVLW